MAHAFDSGLATAQRTAVRAAIAAAIVELRKASLPGPGALYLEAVVELAAPISFTSDETEGHFLKTLAGRSPVVAIALGDRAFVSRGTDNEEWTGDLDVHVYCCSNAARGLVERMAGDVVSAADNSKDPGVETIAEHVFERLAGAPLRAHVAGTLRPVLERVAYLGDDYTVIEQRYAALVQSDINPRRALTLIADSIDTTHEDVDAPTETPVARTLSDLEEP